MMNDHAVIYLDLIEGVMHRILTAAFTLTLIFATFNTIGFAGNDTNDSDRQGTVPMKVFIKKKAEPNYDKARSTRDDYEKGQRQKRKFSTTKKILIGAGIAAAVTAVVVVLANRDLKNGLTN